MDLQFELSIAAIEAFTSILSVHGGVVNAENPSPAASPPPLHKPLDTTCREIRLLILHLSSMLPFRTNRDPSQAFGRLDLSFDCAHSQEPQVLQYIFKETSREVSLHF